MDSLTLDLIEALYVIMKTTTDDNIRVIAAEALIKIPVKKEIE